MKSFFLYSAVIFIFVSALQAQVKPELPKEAVVIETQAITPQRNIVLWMLQPEKNPLDAPDGIYTCPDYTRGSYYSGKASVSLIDSKTKKIINTLEIQNNDGDLPIPYLIERHYYKVPIIDSKKEGKPQILALQDFNGDGKAYEFAVYEAEACMGLDTALFGYSEKQDKVIQYPVELKTNGKTETSVWADYLFAKKPIAKGLWKFNIDYTGRGGTFDKYEIRYDKNKEIFVGTLDSTASAND